MNRVAYEEFEHSVSEIVTKIIVERPDGKRDILKPFKYVNADITYDNEGYEYIKPGESDYRYRYAADCEGEYTICEMSGETVLDKYSFTAACGERHGYIKVSARDKRYFSYVDGTPFMPIGMNMAFPECFAVSNGEEFGHSDGCAYLGLRQYELWFKKAAESGVDLVRLWCGHDYFRVDTKEADEIDYYRFARLDKVIELAKKYGIKLKLTLEQFRRVDYSGDDSYMGRLFIKQFYKKGRRCESNREWLTDSLWQGLWLDKVEEYAKRYAYNDSIFAIELWNEMNCFETILDDSEMFAEWNRNTSKKMHDLFPNHMIVNSLGSCDCNHVIKIYNNFPWNAFDFKQVHSYLDQGAQLSEVANNSIDGLTKVYSEQSVSDMPFIVAETGAVNDCHSGPFRYYLSDDMGILFADCVYTPLFLGCASCGNIWHWDGRYVSAKNLYHMYEPLKKLTEDIAFDEEEFTSENFSDEKAYVLALRGKKHDLYYIRNKSASWQNILRDLIEPDIIDEINIDISGKAEIIPIWDDDAYIENTRVKNIRMGLFIRVNKENAL